MLVCVPRSIEEVSALPKDVLLLIGLKFLTNDYNAYFNLGDLEEIKKINSHIIIRADRIVTEEELDKYLDIISNLDYDFLVTDLGILSYLLDHKPNIKVIYNPETMITNTCDLATYLELNNVYVGVSMEVPFNTWQGDYRSRIYLQAFGLRKMFDSKRKVFSLYNEEKGIKDFPHNIRLIEASRQEVYPSFEDDFGSVIFRPYYINYLDQDLDFAYIMLESLGLNMSIYLKVVNIYSNVLNKKISKEEGLELFKSLNLNTDDGFKFIDSIYEK